MSLSQNETQLVDFAKKLTEAQIKAAQEIIKQPPFREYSGAGAAEALLAVLQALASNYATASAAARNSQ